MVSEAQRKANNKWLQKHPDKRRQYQYASYARKFVRDVANVQQLEKLKDLIDKRMSQLK